jgi:hypothetical protein
MSSKRCSERGEYFGWYTLDTGRQWSRPYVRVVDVLKVNTFLGLHGQKCARERGSETEGRRNRTNANETVGPVRKSPF